MQIELFYNLFTQCDFKFTTDSRTIPAGSIFFALKGENFNGNRFAEQALSKGASYAVIDEKLETPDPRHILVNDVLQFMQELAHFHRKCYDIPILAIGGSNGKTTTKNLIESVLKQRFKTHCTQGNFNNHIGVPITLLQLPIDCEMGIIELGTNSPGEIEALCQITAPTHGLITNIGKEHLEGFGTLEAVAKEESEIYHYLLQNKGVAFINGDDEWLIRMSRALTQKIPFSKNAVNIHTLVPSISFSYKNTNIQSSLMGDYNLDNILTAVAIGEYFGLSMDQIKQGIESYVPDNNRSQWIRKSTHHILLDAYNANPSSMHVAIQNFIQMPQPTKVLILGDMFELGETADVEHLNLLKWIDTLPVHQVYVLGEHFNRVAPQCHHKAYLSMDDLGLQIKKDHLLDAAILVKGSRGMKMERILEYL